MRPSFFLLLLLGFFFFPLFTRLSDIVKVLFFCSTVKNKFYLYITMLSLSFLQVIAWPAATTCPHHVRKPGRKWVREQSAHLSPFHQGRARCHREQDHGEEYGCQEKGGAEGSKHRGMSFMHTLFEIFIFCPKIQLWFPEKIVDFIWVKNSWKCCGFGRFSCWQLWFHEKNCQKKNLVKISWKCWGFVKIEFLDKKTFRIVCTSNFS